MPKVIPVRGGALQQHLSEVDRISAITPPPKRWTELRQRLTAVIDFDSQPMMGRLLDAVIEGRGDDIPLLRALACAETDPEQRATVTSKLRAAAAAELRRIYAQTAVASCGKIAAAFDDAATRFTDAAGKCDGGNPELDATPWSARRLRRRKRGWTARRPPPN